MSFSKIASFPKKNPLLIDCFPFKVGITLRVDICAALPSGLQIREISFTLYTPLDAKTIVVDIDIKRPPL